MKYEVRFLAGFRANRLRSESLLAGGMETQIVRNIFGIEEDTVYYQGWISHFTFKGKINRTFSQEHPGHKSKSMSSIFPCFLPVYSLCRPETAQVSQRGGD